jgi:hypothetical protein
MSDRRSQSGPPANGGFLATKVGVTSIALLQLPCARDQSHLCGQFRNCIAIEAIRVAVSRELCGGNPSHAPLTDPPSLRWKSDSNGKAMIFLASVSLGLSAGMPLQLAPPP